MPSISVTGVGSGIDINSLVSELVAAERQPVVNQLNRREAKLQAELSAIGTLKGALSQFNTTVSGLTSVSKFQAVKATVGDESLFTASAASIAQPASYSVEVQQLAQSQKLASARFTDVSDVVGTGTLTFTFGSYNSGADTFTANADKPAKTVTIDSSNQTLTGVRDAINEANIGVRANIVNDGEGYRLVLSSTETGAKNGLKISVSDGDGNPTDNLGLSQLVYDPTTVGVKNLTETMAAQDAKLKVDGLDVISPSNTLTGVVQGVTLNLKSAKLGVTTQLTVAKDTEAVKGTVESFVNAYNTLVGVTNSLTSYDPDTRQAGILLGDAGVRAVTNQMRRIIGEVVTGTTGSVRALADIGVTTQKDGTLALDSAKLDKAVADDSEGIAALFTRTGRTSDSLISYASSTSKSKPGSYEVNITQLATRGSFTGSTVNSLTVNNDNDTFALKVDGVESGTITLNQGVYASGEDLAAELQNQINADANLQASKIMVSVTYDSDHFVITSTRYGSSSTVEFTSVDTNTANDLGFSLGSGAAGVDVAGTIGGMAANGAGQRLTGTGDAEGLAVDVLGGATGARDTLFFSDGAAERMRFLLDEYLKTTGPLDSRTDSLNKRISQIGEQRTTLDDRMSALETRYRNQFTAMDKLVNQLRNTGDFLNQQLSSALKVYEQR